MTDDEDDWEETESECEDDESVCGSETEWTECEEDEETMIAPLDVVRFGDVEMDREYREALYREHPYYTAEEVVGTYLGHNPMYPRG